MEMLHALDWNLGGESSGHVVNLDLTTTGDGIITALQVLRAMQFAEKSLHEMKKIMTKRPQVLINIPAQNCHSLLEKESFKAHIRYIENELKDLGRVLLRLSGTEPVVRVMVEASDLLKAQQAAEYLAGKVVEAQA